MGTKNDTPSTYNLRYECILGYEIIQYARMQLLPESGYSSSTRMPSKSFIESRDYVGNVEGSSDVVNDVESDGSGEEARMKASWLEKKSMVLLPLFWGSMQVVVEWLL